MEIITTTFNEFNKLYLVASTYPSSSFIIYAGSMENYWILSLNHCMTFLTAFLVSGIIIKEEVDIDNSDGDSSEYPSSFT